MKLLSTTCTVLAFAALGLVSCTESGIDSESTPEATSVHIGQSLFDVIDLEQKAQMSYRWSGAPGGDTGLVVFRSDGGVLKRWDSIAKPTLPPREGDLLVSRTQNGVTDEYGCIWIAIEGEPDNVRAGCGDGGPLVSIHAALSLALVTSDQIEEALEARQILGVDAECYTTRTIPEVCIDEVGRLLFLSTGRGDSMDTFEAFSVSDQPEPFDWPFDQDIHLTPTNFETPQSRDALDLPIAFTQAVD